MSEITAINLAADVLREADEVLADDHQVLGVWLKLEPMVEQLKAKDDSTPPHATKRELATTEEAPFVKACGDCATALLNSMTEEQRTTIGGAISGGAHLRVYVRPDSNEVLIVLAGKDGKHVELARHVVEIDPMKLH